jgi:hypothetical protein
MKGGAAMRGAFVAVIGSLLSCLVSSGALSTAPPKGAALEDQLSAFLQSGTKLDDMKPTNPLFPLRQYPLLATTAFVVFEDRPQLLKNYYPALSDMVLDRFKGEHVAANGLFRDAVPGASPGQLSPALNALADLELWSLSLIAWRVGAYEDALDLRAWSNKLSETMTTTFFDPAAEGFYPINADGRFIPDLSPGELLPLAVNRSLGDNAVARVIEGFASRGSPLLEGGRGFRGELWDDAALRPLINDLLSRSLGGDNAVRRIVGGDPWNGPWAAPTDVTAWTAYWRDNPAAVNRLFPDWRVIATIVNLTLLLERESLVDAADMAAFKGEIDTIATALTAKETSLDSYGQTIATANQLLGRLSRFSDLTSSDSDRWRMIDGAKWLTLSPRTKRLIQEACPGAIDDVMRAKAELSRRLAESAGIALDVELPKRPVSVGRPIDFHAVLSSSREKIDISQLILQIGEIRWKPVGADVVVSLGPGLSPFAYDESFALPGTTEPGVVTLPLFADFVCGGRRIEIHRIESLTIATAYDVSFDLPEGHRVGASPLPVEIAVRLSPDHDIQGTLEGTFLHELRSRPVLPAKFLLKGGSDHTDLNVSFSAPADLAPGRYPVSLTVTLDGRALASFDDELVKPMRWLYLAPLTAAENVLAKGPRYQTDLLKTYKTVDGRIARWRETPSEATDSEGALRPQRIPGTAPNGCMLLYTVIDSPMRMKLQWRLSTKNTTALWLNSEPLRSAPGSREDEMTGPLELRKGPNSFLIAVCMKRSPEPIVFELSDENGLPATSLGNELQNIVEGYEKLGEPEEPKHAEAPAPDRVREITITYESADATEVSVIGSFNNWDPGITPMKKVGLKRWTAQLFLAPGHYSYKFLVNRKVKIVDPSCALSEPDGFGGNNSVLEVR